MNISSFGEKTAKTSGIGRLMQDLGQALASSGEMLMLGGGNPAHIPDVQKHVHQAMQGILDNEAEFKSAIGDYDPPGGNIEFISLLANLLNSEFGWGIGPENIALTNGSQSGFFSLFNIFAGRFKDGVKKKILFPLAPEYIGYSDVGINEGIFTSYKPKIEFLGDKLFKYHIDFDAIEVGEDIGAMCVSRPTNPTGNVLTNIEIEKLSNLARSKNVPLIIDNAYGTPFPDIIFTEATPIFNDNTILCMSLSKFGLPALRTGIIIANPQVISYVSEMNAVMCLAPGSFGPSIASKLVRNGDIIKLSKEVIRPFYETKAQYALEILQNELADTNCYIHKPEGSLFFWLWSKDCPISDMQLYERLKQRNVLVVPGNYFFPGLEEQWQHKNECIRINYARDKETVTKGLQIIAEEIKQAYAK